MLVLKIFCICKELEFCLGLSLATKIVLHNVPVVVFSGFQDNGIISTVL